MAQRTTLGHGLLLTSALVAVLPAATFAQVPDHTRCYKVKPTSKTQALVDLTAVDPSLGAQSDCKVKGPVLYCAPVEKTNVRATPPAPGAPAGPPVGDHLCYTLSCAKHPVGPRVVSDQFGAFQLDVRGNALLCTPATVLQPTTTTTTTSSTTTTTRTYVWLPEAFGACSVPCGGGTQSRPVLCVDAATGGQVGAILCDPATMPATTQVCNTQPCPTYAWQAGPFGACSVPCGGGTQSRTVTCVDTSGTVVSDTFCDSQTMPIATQPCNTQPCT